MVKFVDVSSYGDAIVEGALDIYDLLIIKTHNNTSSTCVLFVNTQQQRATETRS